MATVPHQLSLRSETPGSRRFWQTLSVWAGSGGRRTLLMCLRNFLLTFNWRNTVSPLLEKPKQSIVYSSITQSAARWRPLTVQTSKHQIVKSIAQLVDVKHWHFEWKRRGCSLRVPSNTSFFYVLACCGCFSGRSAVMVAGPSEKVTLQTNTTVYSTAGLV